MTEETQLQPYDKTEFYKATIRPVMDQLYELCRAHDIPLVAVACYAIDGKKSTMHESVHLIGPQRTPDVMAAMLATIKYPEAARAAYSAGVMAAQMAQQEQADDHVH